MKTRTEGRAVDRSNGWPEQIVIYVNGQAKKNNNKYLWNKVHILILSKQIESSAEGILRQINHIQAFKI